MSDRPGAERRGRRAEAIAACWLRLKGYHILGRRVRCARGEIDLIARRGKTVAFVEVKQRKAASNAAWAIDERSLRRVTAAVEMLGPRYAARGEVIRVDAVLVVPFRLPRHLTNIWHK